MPGPGAVLCILKSPCPSLDTIAFSVSLLIQPREAGALQTLSKSEADGKESKVHVSIRTALISKAELITFQLQRPGTTWVALSGFLRSSSWLVFRERAHPQDPWPREPGPLSVSDLRLSLQIPASELEDGLPPLMTDPPRMTPPEERSPRTCREGPGAHTRSRAHTMTVSPPLRVSYADPRHVWRQRGRKRHEGSFSRDSRGRPRN